MTNPPDKNAGPAGRARSETDLIQGWLAPLAAKGGLGLSDDAARYQTKPGYELVLTVDTIVEGVHFLSTDTPFDIAIKAVTVNLSDLVAKGADDVGYLVALSLPHWPEDAWMSEFARGLGEQISGKLLGGDTTVSRGGPLTISITAIGEAPGGGSVARKGASIGDAIYVCGEIGSKAAGLKCVLDPDWARVAGLDEGERRELVTQYSAPRVAFAGLVARTIRDHATASIDISDGLAIDLERLCAASGAGAEVDIPAIPLNPVVRKLIDGRNFSLIDAITGGDDYTALFTAPQSHCASIEAATQAKCHRIGTLVEKEKGVTFRGADGSPLSIGARKGYDHFGQ